MSLENVERHRRFVEAFVARDADAILEFCDPEIELHSAFTAIGGAVYRGHEGIRRWHRDLDEAWDDMEISGETYFDLGDDVLIFYVLAGRRPAESGVEVGMENALVATWRDGRMTYFKVFRERDEALSELGLSHDALAAARVVGLRPRTCRRARAPRRPR